MSQVISYSYRIDTSQSDETRAIVIINCNGQDLPYIDSYDELDLGFSINDEGELVDSSGLVQPGGAQALWDAAIQESTNYGVSQGWRVEGKVYKEGDIFPQGADPNQVGPDPPPGTSPTEDGITPISTLPAGTLPITPPTLAPIPQGVGLNDAVATDTAPATNTERPEEKVIDNNAFNYTGSPLGLVNSKNFKYSKDSSSDNTPFSKRNFLFSQGNGSKGGNKISDNPLDFEKGSSDLHQDSVYDISTNNIIDKLSAYPALSLKWADFAYCRDFGVYPNNRLAICRRFAAPQNDDLTFVEGVSSPISTLVTWIDDTQNILEFNFGEEWVEAGASFVELLNEVGDDIGMKFAKLGDMLAMAANGVPLPGMTEQFQRKILAALGVVSSDSAGIIPSGTPNLIKESRQRKLIKDDTPGSGLIGKFNIKVKCSWEQKFISGVDPTLIYYDILHTILSFGGSQAVFYLGKKSNLTNLGTLLDKYSKPGGAVQIITDVMDAIQKEIRDLKPKILAAIDTAFNGENPPKDAEVDPNDANAVKESEDKAKEANAQAEKERNNQLEKAKGIVQEIIDSFLQSIIKKYRVRVLGIVSTLTGIPSTPWHITIGNPLRPIFSSGDMECSDVNVNLGPQLSFNDLPSYIECEFTLKSARNLGIDEIMAKLNCGSIRISDEAPSFWNLYEEKAYVKPDDTTPSPTASTATASTVSEVSNTEGSVGPLSNEVIDALPGVEGQGVLTPEAAIEIAAQSKVGNEITTNGVSLNPDPNSAEVLLGKVEPAIGDEYTVKAGDSISKIAKNKLGPNASQSEILAETKRIISLNKNKNPIEVDGIVNTNSQSDPDFIKPGDKLFI